MSFYLPEEVGFRRMYIALVTLLIGNLPQGYWCLYGKPTIQWTDTPSSSPISSTSSSCMHTYNVLYRWTCYSVDWPTSTAKPFSLQLQVDRLICNHHTYYVKLCIIVIVLKNCLHMHLCYNFTLSHVNLHTCPSHHHQHHHHHHHHNTNKFLTGFASWG